MEKIQGLDAGLLEGLAQQTEFFGPMEEPLRTAGLSLWAVDSQARLESRPTPDGEATVAFVFPLDDDEIPDNGRLWMRDEFRFEANGSLREYHRRFFAGEAAASSPAWQERLDGLRQAATRPPDPVVKAFAESLVRPLLSSPSPVPTVSPQAFEGLRLPAFSAGDRAAMLRRGLENRARQEGRLARRAEAFDLLETLAREALEARLARQAGWAFAGERLAAEPARAALRRFFSQARDLAQQDSKMNALQAIAAVPAGGTQRFWQRELLSQARYGMAHDATQEINDAVRMRQFEALAEALLEAGYPGSARYLAEKHGKDAGGPGRLGEMRRWFAGEASAAPGKIEFLGGHHHRAEPAGLEQRVRTRRPRECRFARYH